MGPVMRGSPQMGVWFGCWTMAPPLGYPFFTLKKLADRVTKWFLWGVTTQEGQSASYGPSSLPLPTSTEHFITVWSTGKDMLLTFRMLMDW